MLHFDIMLVKGQVNGCGFGNVDGGADSYDTNHGKGGRQKWQQQSESWTVDNLKDVATISAGRAE